MISLSNYEQGYIQGLKKAYALKVLVTPKIQEKKKANKSSIM